MMAENVEDMVGLPYLDNQGPDAGLAMQQPRSAKPALLKGIKKESKKCPHGKQKSVCSDCGGSGLCQHARQKSRCTDCGGSVQAKCPHGKQKSVCKDCDGSGLCQHGRRKDQCTQCQTLAEIAGLDMGGTTMTVRRYNQEH